MNRKHFIHWKYITYTAIRISTSNPQVYAIAEFKFIKHKMEIFDKDKLVQTWLDHSFDEYLLIFEKYLNENY